MASVALRSKSAVITTRTPLSSTLEPSFAKLVQHVAGQMQQDHGR
jgi:hypothetical protein